MEAPPGQARRTLSLLAGKAVEQYFVEQDFLVCVRWYCKYGIGYRDLEEMMAERGAVRGKAFEHGGSYHARPRTAMGSVPAALASLHKAGLKIDIMTASFFLGRWTIKPAPNSGMPLSQDRLIIALSRQAANATGFFAIPSDRVVELGAQVTF